MEAITAITWADITGAVIIIPAIAGIIADTISAAAIDTTPDDTTDITVIGATTTVIITTDAAIGTDAGGHTALVAAGVGRRTTMSSSGSATDVL